MTYSVTDARRTKIDNMVEIITKPEGEKANKTDSDLFGDITKYRNGYGVLYLINLLKDVWGRLLGSPWREERKTAIIEYVREKFDDILKENLPNGEGGSNKTRSSTIGSIRTKAKNGGNSDKENLIAHIQTKMVSIATKTESEEQYSLEDEFYMYLIVGNSQLFEGYIHDKHKYLISNIQLNNIQSRELIDAVKSMQIFINNNDLKYDI